MENSILENNLAMTSEVNMCGTYDQETLLLKIYSRVFLAVTEMAIIILHIVHIYTVT